MTGTLPNPGAPAHSETAPAVSSRIPGLDGLRALAVTAVLVFHLMPGWLPGGAIGVDVFFVVSGFLITSLLLRERRRTGRIDLRDFWVRRARRLLPAIGLLVLTTATLALAVGGDVLVRLGWQVLGAATFSFNWLSLLTGADYFDSTAPELLRNLWSLAVEEQFYLLWPLLLLALLLVPGRGARIAIVLGGAAASALAMAMLHDPAVPTRVYYGTDTHSFGLLLGAGLALALEHRPAHALEWPRALRATTTALGWGGLAGLVALALWLPAEGPAAARGGFALAALCTAAVIGASVVPGARIARTLGARWLRAVGDRSYGLYLWHWPVFVLATTALPGWRVSPSGALALGALTLLVTVVAAELSLRLVENPVRRLGFRATIAGFLHWWRRPLWRTAVAVTLTVGVIAAGAATVTAVTIDPRSSAQASIELGQAAIGAGPSSPQDPAAGSSAAASGDGVSAGPAAPPVPAPSPPPSLPAGEGITAIGDSVMLAVTPSLQQAFPGISVDAVVSRQLRAAPELLQAQADAGLLRDTVVVALGTNGAIAPDTLERVHTIVGPQRRLVLVNVQAPRIWTEGVNATLDAFAQQHRNVELANWRDAIAPRLGLLAGDQIHAGGPDAGAVYVAALTGALQRLAQLPPVLDRHDYGLADLPQ